MDILSRGIPSERLRVSVIVACGIAAERLEFTAGFEVVLGDEDIDASLNNSDTFPDDTGAGEN